MADSEARKILTGIWARNGFRQEPEAVGLDRNEGFSVAYEQSGAGQFPQRGVFNQLFCELYEAFDEKIEYNFPRWDRNVDYPASEQTGYAFVIGSNGRLYVSLAPSGPSLGNSTDPVTLNQSVWREY